VSDPEQDVTKTQGRQKIRGSAWVMADPFPEGLVVGLNPVTDELAGHSFMWWLGEPSWGRWRHPLNPKGTEMTERYLWATSMGEGHPVCRCGAPCDFLERAAPRGQEPSGS
jgi:hypothetical protein